MFYLIHLSQVKLMHNGTENSNVVKFEYQTFNLLDLSHVNQGPQCRKTLDSSQHSSAKAQHYTYHLQTTIMVQAQKIYPINLLDLSHANHGPAPECRMTAVSIIPISITYRQQYNASAKALPHFYHTVQQCTKRHNTARLGVATSNIDAAETPQSLMKED